MENWVTKNLINIALTVTFITTLVLVILSVLKVFALPDYGFVILPLILLAIIVIAKGDISLKIGDLFQIKKEIGSVKDELVVLNTKISNINTNQNITILSVSPTDVKEILDQVKSKTTLSEPNIIAKSSSIETQNGDSNAK